MKRGKLSLEAFNSTTAVAPRSPAGDAQLALRYLKAFRYLGPGDGGSFYRRAHPRPGVSLNIKSSLPQEEDARKSPAVAFTSAYLARLESPAVNQISYLREPRFPRDFRQFSGIVKGAARRAGNNAVAKLIFSGARSCTKLNRRRRAKGRSSPSRKTRAAINREPRSLLSTFLS